MSSPIKNQWWWWWYDDINFEHISIVFIQVQILQCTLKPFTTIPLAKISLICTQHYVLHLSNFSWKGNLCFRTHYQYLWSPFHLNPNFVIRSYSGSLWVALRIFVVASFLVLQSSIANFFGPNYNPTYDFKKCWN